MGKRHRPGRLRVMDQQDSEELKDKQAGGPVAAAVYGQLTAFLERRAWRDDVRLRFELPVHAYGYDWTGDLRRSGAGLAEQIEGIIAFHAGKGRRCRQVVLVTHSAGGLVARWACRQAGVADRVLGVIHGAQPTHGTPVTYQVMKAGVRQPSAQDYGDALSEADDLVGAARGAAKVFLLPYILGPTGRHTAATLGNMPCALQLLPSGRYRTNSGQRGWLGLAGLDDRKPAGRDADPYADVYLEQEGFWRLATPELLEPLPQGSGRSRRQAARDYRRNVQKARAFHQELGSSQHPRTYHLHGEGTRHATPDEVLFSARSVRMKRGGKMRRADVDPASDEGRVLLRDAWASPSPGSRAAPGVTSSFGRGGFSAEVEVAAGTFLHATLQDAAGAGDGTVPVSAGKALAEAPGTAGSTGFADVDHQLFFGDKHRQVQLKVVEHIEQLCMHKIAGGGKS